MQDKVSTIQRLVSQHASPVEIEQAVPDAYAFVGVGRGIISQAVAETPKVTNRIHNAFGEIVRGAPAGTHVTINNSSHVVVATQESVDENNVHQYWWVTLPS